MIVSQTSSRGQMKYEHASLTSVVYTLNDKQNDFNIFWNLEFEKFNILLDVFSDLPKNVFKGIIDDTFTLIPK